MEDLPQLRDEIGEGVGPLKVIAADGDLATATSHNAPAEPLSCGQRLQP